MTAGPEWENTNSGHAATMNKKVMAAAMARRSSPALLLLPE